MDTPYTKDQILRLIERKFESLKVDYKQAYPLGDLDHQRELIKDVSAMANTIEPDDTLEQMGFDPGYGFIIIGCDENGNIYNTAVFDLDDAVFQQIVNERVEPKIQFLFVPYEHEDPTTGEVLNFGVITILPSEQPPHRIAQNIKPQFSPLRGGECYKRVGTSTSRVTLDTELERLFSHRARFSEFERRLQREEFRVSDVELKRISEIFVPPGSVKVVEESYNTLLKYKFLFIKGEMGVGKRTMALQMATRLIDEKHAFRLLRMSRLTQLSEFRDTEGAVIILPDFFGLFRFERLDVEKEIGIIEHLKCSNFLILTSSDAVFSEMLKETRLEEWDLLHDAQLNLFPESYTLEIRRKIVENHLRFSQEAGRILPSQAEWVKSLIKSSKKEVQALLNTLRLPLDIKRFIDEYLPKIDEQDQLFVTLQQVGNVQNEVQKWFNTLSSDERIFLFVMVLFNGLDRQKIWHWYELITSRLRKLNPNLATLSLGELSSRTEPYIVFSIEGNTPQFSYPRIHIALMSVIAKGYREFFIRLIPDFIEATVPPRNISQEERDAFIVNTQAERDVLSFAAGEIGSLGVDELFPLIETWASYEKGRVRLAAVETLSQAAKNPGQTDAILSILRTWAGNRGDDRAIKAKRWTSAVTCGQLGQVALNESIELLHYISKDPERTVRSGVPKAARMLFDLAPEKVTKIYVDLSADSDSFTRREVANTLRSISYRKPNLVGEMIQGWSQMESKNRAWTVTRIIFTIRKMLLHERSLVLANLLFKHPAVVVQSFRDSAKEGDLAAWQTFELVDAYVELYRDDSWPGFGVLYSAIEEVFPDEAWARIQSWIGNEDRYFRLAAAFALSYLNQTKPDRAGTLIDVLLLDSDPEVSMVASVEPLITITLDDLADEDLSNVGDVDNPISSIVIYPDESDDGILILE